MSDKNKKLNIVIGGQSIPITATPGEIDMLKNVEAEINEKLLGLKRTYPHLDPQKCLAMVTLTYAMEAEHKEQPEDSSLVTEKLNALNKKLASALQ